MRLLLLNSIGRTKWGGGEKWMLMTAKKLISRGHEVYIGCSQNSLLERHAKADELTVLPISIYSDFSLIGLLKLKKYYKEKPFDAIIGCQNRDVRIAGFLVKKLLKSNCLVYSRQGVQLLNNSIKYKYSFLPFCDGIITNTNTIKKEYDSYGWWADGFVKVIHNGVENHNDELKPFDYGKFIKINENSYKVLSTGRLSTQKGFKYLIDAAKEVIKLKPDTYFFIAGKGKLKRELKEQISKNGLTSNVFLIGFQENVIPLLKGADLFVLPSLYEGMPNSLMEAMSVGIPVISTKVNGVTELMEDKKHGLIIPPANKDELVKTILSMIDCKNYQEMGLNAKKHVAENFTIDKMVDEIESFLLLELAKKK
nr:glycosyltransferase [uncultured Carboxylicivirga sp.]